MYFEIIARDPLQDPPDKTWMGIESVTRPGMLTFAVRPTASQADVGGEDSLQSMVEAARKKGYDPKDVQEYSRLTTTGETLKWKLSYNHFKAPLPGDGIVPFLIAWGDGGASLPPTTTPQGCRLVELKAMHPDPASVLPSLEALDITMQVVVGPVAQIVAVLDTPKGRVEVGQTMDGFPE